MKILLLSFALLKLFCSQLFGLQLTPVLPAQTLSAACPSALLQNR